MRSWMTNTPRSKSTTSEASNAGSHLRPTAYRGVRNFQLQYSISSVASTETLHTDIGFPGPVLASIQYLLVPKELFESTPRSPH